ncbi:hypothetical protein NW759_000362 [Fusarium solani]|jgi:hypothetical protein|nr:hypothetical protein NW759_000362 [Fusarium solani]
MCSEAVAQCPVCFSSVTLLWKYCMPYLKTSLEVCRQDEGLTPPAAWFSPQHQLKRSAVQGLGAAECPNAACPSKIPPMKEG